MDIRVSAYRPITVTTASGKGPLATATVQNAAQSQPVSPAAPIQVLRNNQAAEAQRNFAVTETRGTLVNILA